MLQAMPVPGITDWRVERGKSVVHSDTGEHVSSILRILQIDEVTWRKTIARYASKWTPRCHEIGPRMTTLGEAFRACAPRSRAVDATSSVSPCPICREARVSPVFSRRDSVLVYGRCSGCGHGSLVCGGAPCSIYSAAEYYGRRACDGTGYANYEQERAYREARGAGLLAQLKVRGSSTRVLEVGSAFGFTRKAAQDLGCRTFGVDLSPHASATARRLYGMSTYVGTLDQALRAGAVRRGEWDLVLYQFVLEHLSDPIAELRLAASTLASGGRLALLVPSMEALEIDVFGAAYRSFRADHLHLFSRRSLHLALGAAGLRCEAYSTGCSVHLLAGFLSADEQKEVYERGRGPDILAVARGLN